MKAEFQTYIQQHQLFQSNSKLLLALSGGRDSIVLADLLSKCGYNFSIAHCNFQLREAESEQDAKFADQTATTYGCKFYCQRFNTSQYASENKISIQMSARELRLNWLEKTRKEEGFDYIVLAHHADDQSETFFINLIRGSSIFGLKGMKPKQGLIVRPILFASRSEINTYIKENKLKYRDDSSNFTSKYLRNHIRHHLIPALKNTHSNALNGLSKSIQLLADDALLFEKLLQKERQRLIKPIDQGFIINKNEFSHEGGNSTLLFALIKDFGFSSDQANMIHQSIQNQPGKKFLSKEFVLMINRSTIEIQPVNRFDNDLSTTIQEETQKITKPVSLSFNTIDKSDLNELRMPATTAIIDRDLLQFPLIVRHYRQGDKFQPFGMKGTMLLSDFFTNQHLSQMQKMSSFVLTDNDDQIIWVIGYRIDNRYRISETTKNILRIELHNDLSGNQD